MNESISPFFKEGRLVTIPKKLAKKEAVFAYLQTELSQKGQIFTEKEVNEILANYYDDYAILRRYLVDYGFLLRDKYGLEYRLSENMGISCDNASTAIS